MDLEVLAAKVIDDLIARKVGATRGNVQTTQKKPPYQRIDCDNRALAYVRVRPRKKIVRIELAGKWKVPRASPLMIDSKGGPPVLALRWPKDQEEAIAFLTEVIIETRASEARVLSKRKGPSTR